MTKAELFRAVRAHKGPLYVSTWNASGEAIAWPQVSRAAMVRSLKDALMRYARDEETGFQLLEDGSLTTDD